MRRFTFKSFIKAIGMVFGLVLVTVGIVYAFGAYNNRSSAVGFQQYEPQQLPRGLNIEKRTIEIWANRTNPLAPNKLLRIYSNDKNFTMGEEAYNGYAYSCKQVTVNAECRLNETPKGQKYELTTSTQYQSPNNTPIGQDMYLRKGNTHIWVHVSGNPSKIYTNIEWNTLIDSLTLTSYKNLPTEHFTPGP